MHPFLAFISRADLPMAGFLVAYFLVAVIGFLWLSAESSRIHGRLAGFRKQAEGLDRLALLALRGELIAFHRKECWHIRFGQHAREVLAYIDERLAKLPPATPENPA